MNFDSLLKRIERLPDESRQALLTTLDQLVKKSENAPPATRVFKFDWESGLADAFPGANSVDLQHEANTWR